MAQAKKGRGSSRRKNPKPKPKKAPNELVPHKIIGQLVGKRLDEHGEIVAEEEMGPVAIFAANFGKVDQIVNQAVEQAREQEAAARGPAAEMRS